MGIFIMGRLGMGEGTALDWRYFLKISTTLATLGMTCFMDKAFTFGIRLSTLLESFKMARNCSDNFLAPNSHIVDNLITPRK